MKDLSVTQLYVTSFDEAYDGYETMFSMLLLVTTFLFTTSVGRTYVCVMCTVCQMGEFPLLIYRICIVYLPTQFGLIKVDSSVFSLVQQYGFPVTCNVGLLINGKQHLVFAIKCRSEIAALYCAAFVIKRENWCFNFVVFKFVIIV